MKYDISKSSAPKMPNLGKGTECIKKLFYKTHNSFENCLFRCFLLYFARKYVLRKNSITISF